MNNKDKELRKEIKEWESKVNKGFTTDKYGSLSYLRGKLDGRQEARQEVLNEVEKMINAFPCVIEKGKWFNKEDLLQQLKSLGEKE